MDFEDDLNLNNRGSVSGGAGGAFGGDGGLFVERHEEGVYFGMEEVFPVDWDVLEYLQDRVYCFVYDLCVDGVGERR